MDELTDECGLIRKLVATCHLNVAERKLLPARTAKASLVLDAIEEQLRRGRWFPADLRAESDFAGGVIELNKDGRCRIYWKSEYSMLRYELDAIGEFATPREAAITYLRAMFPEHIDGIAIDWQA
jgi:hypothetical protein